MTFKEALLAVAVGVMVYRYNKYKKETQLWCTDIESRLQALEATIETRREPHVMGPPVSPFVGGAIKMPKRRVRATGFGGRRLMGE